MSNWLKGSIILLIIAILMLHLNHSSLPSLSQLAGTSVSSLGVMQHEEPPLSLRILVAVTAFDDSHQEYIEFMIDRLESDVCAGDERSNIHIKVLFYQSPAATESFSKRTGSCNTTRNSSFEYDSIVKAEKKGVRLSAHHRAYFLNATTEDYDLFVYSEDDLFIQLKHMQAYLRETDRLESLTNSYSYSIGFLRYEIDPRTNKCIAWEQLNPDWLTLLPNNNNNSNSSYYVMTRPPRNRTDGDDWKHGMYHQGMYMATPQQLQHWARTCPCFVDPLGRPARKLFREMVSSVCLY